MSIRFNCPECENLTTFEDKYAGKQAHCTNCGTHFIIPAESFQKPQMIQLELEIPKPLPGFFRSVFIDTWKLFYRSQNLKTLIFITAAVAFKFFLYEPCCRYLSLFIVWAWLLGFYLNLIEQTACGEDKLPEIVLGTGTPFMVNIIKPHSSS